MSQSETYVKLFRKITEWEWYKDANTARVFIHLLLKASWSGGRYKGHPVEIGQAISGYKATAEALGITERAVRTAFEHLKTTGEVTVKVTSKFSIVTICNYSKYSGGIFENDNQNASQNASQLTSNRQASDKQSTAFKKERKKEGKKEKTQDLYTGEASHQPAVTKCVSKAIVKKPTESKGGRTWAAYSEAYQHRYGVAPVRNQKTNIACAQMVDRLGADDAPSVAAWYLQSRNAFYATTGHTPAIMVRDAEKLRTEWATGRQISANKAKEEERLEEQGYAWMNVINRREAARQAKKEEEESQNG